jgi:four helix bundle protein
MNEIRDHRDLEAWQVAMDVVTQTYKLSASFPRTEIYGLSSQMRRAAVSAPSNIAEGQARMARACVNHLGIALGSLAELDTQLEVAVRLGYTIGVAARDLKQRIDSSRRLIHGLRRAKRRQLVGTVGAVGTLFGILFLRLFT